jgi:hypothetical protein
MVEPAITMPTEDAASLPSTAEHDILKGGDFRRR